MTQLYRTLRVIEYIGPLEWINDQKTKDSVKGTYVIKSTNDNDVEKYINSSYIGEPIKLGQ